MWNKEFFFTVLIQVTLIFIFITIFFFTYAKNKEKDVVINNIDLLLDSIIPSDLVGILPTNYKKIIIDNLNEIQNDHQQDNVIKENNKKVFRDTIRILLIVLFLISILLFLYAKKIRLSSIFIQSFIIVFFVGLTEYIFLTFFASKFISVDPQLIKYTFIKEIQKFINE